MAASYESADLVLKLYDVRREATMREARNWFRLSFNPDSAREIVAGLEGPQSDFFRMVVSYWDMAASLVNHGLIDEALFNDVNLEHLGTFARVEPFLADLRAGLGNPDFLAQLERLVTRLPDAVARLADIRKQLREAGARQSRTASASDPASTPTGRPRSDRTSERPRPQAQV